MPNPRHEPVRTCVACREEAPKAMLVRLVKGKDGAAAIDPSGRAEGRGAYLHHDAACVETARKRRQLERSLSASVPPSVWLELTS